MQWSFCVVFLRTEVDENDADAYETAINKIDQLSDEVLMNESGKVMVVMDLVQNLRESGHRCLIFSQSRKMLDIMQRILTNRVGANVFYAIVVWIFDTFDNNLWIKNDFTDIFGEEL